MQTSERLFAGPGSAIDRAILGFVGGRLRCGRLIVRLPDGTVRAFSGPLEGPTARVDLHDTSVLRRLAAMGAIALADAYIDGRYDSPDLAALIELGSLHMEPAYRTEVPDSVQRGLRTAWRKIGRAFETRGPVRDIVHHYDLGNDFYAAWLDPSMTYSSAVFASDETTLEAAQLEKYRRLAAAADIRQGHRVLEIGSGWGGFAAFLAAEHGADVTTMTVSREQATYVEKLAAEEGLADRLRVELRDFREAEGTFDRVVSIEMIESIPGHRWSEFFGVVGDRLVPGGRAGLQIITVADRHWTWSDENPDFVRRYVFPGGQVPSPGVLRRLSESAGLTWIADGQYGTSYARTLGAWLERFDAAWPQIAELGFDEPFRRMWRYYLAYCQGGFASGRTDVSQLVLARG
ncbi:MAG: cyclopropane-fatty-acyl-phospholipid synthase family protein [Actinomycetota bacterium]